MINRVSRWFSMGFRCAETGRTEAQLPVSQCENEWQKMEMVRGFAAFQPGEKCHIQYWLVSGPERFDEIETAVKKESERDG